jgi:hypothetical protein
MSDQLAGASATSTGTPLPAGRGWRATRTALHLRPSLALGEWERLGRRVAEVADSSAWWVGDWLLFGERSYGRRYRAAVEATGLDYQTLRNYAWVASRFPVSRRRDQLTFGHHAEVASLSEDDQDTWLRRAALERWSRNELRRRLRSVRLGEAAPSAGERPIELAVEAERRAQWEAAAAAEGRPLDEWISAVLDRAAATILTERRPLVAA